MRCIMIVLASLLAGCAKEVPVAVEPRLPKAPPECRRETPARLPAVPEIAGKAASPEQVNAHWARAYRKADGIHAVAVATAAVCQRYARRIGG